MQYNAAIYWAMVTITTIGYGDVVPKTNPERMFVTFAMLIGAGAYGYMVGSICGLLSNMSSIDQQLHAKIDGFNAFCAKNPHIPKKLRFVYV